MNAKKFTWLMCGVLTATILMTVAADGQVGRLRIQRGSYFVKIVSQYGFPVRVGIFGYSTQANCRIDFDGGRTGPDVYTQELIAGERVVFVWDRQQRPLLVARVTVDTNGTLVVGPGFGAAARGGPAARAEAGAGAAPLNLPELKIEP